VSEMVLYARLSECWLAMLCRGWELAGDLGDYHGRFSVLLRWPA
jgi:hypothetical protein